MVFDSFSLQQTTKYPGYIFFWIGKLVQCKNMYVKPKVLVITQCL